MDYLKNRLTAGGFSFSEKYAVKIMSQEYDKQPT